MIRVILMIFSLFAANASFSQIWLMDGNGCRFFDQYERSPEEILIEWDGGCQSGYLTGKGILKKYKSGQIVVTFEGELELGKYKSPVTWRWPDGNTYAGEIKNSNMTGKGKFTWANGNVYEGDFVNGERTGKGKYYFTNGDFYEGDFYKGVRTGKGKFKLKDGDVYEGDFLNNKYHGWGKMTYSYGDVFEGEFKNGAKNGQGKYEFANSTTYSYHKGIYRNDKKNGLGKLYYPDGTFIDGNWVDDQMSTLKASGNGSSGVLNSEKDVKYSNTIYSPKPTAPATTSYNNNSNPNNRPSPSAAPATTYNSNSSSAYKPRPAAPVASSSAPAATRSTPAAKPAAPAAPAAQAGVEEINMDESDPDAETSTEVASMSNAVVPVYKWEFVGYWSTLENGQYKRTVNVIRNGQQFKSASIKYVFNNDDNTFYIDVAGLDKNFSFLYKPQQENSLVSVSDKHTVNGIKDLESAFFQSVQYAFEKNYR